MVEVVGGREGGRWPAATGRLATLEAADREIGE